MRAHLIVDGVVTNTIEVDSLDFMPGLVEATEGGIGWLYDGKTFSAPPVPQVSEAKQANSVRVLRTEKLKECDWTQVIDAPVNQEEWATYRQALRDITTQEGFPTTIVWPDKP